MALTGGWGIEARTERETGRGLRCPGGGGEDQDPGGVGLVGWAWHGWVTPGFKITVWGRKCSKFEHFRPQTMIMGPLCDSTRPPNPETAARPTPGPPPASQALL